MAASEGVKVHTQGRVNHAVSTTVSGDVFSFKGGPTGCVMIMEPMSPFLNYYEYVILDKGAEASIGIGIGERGYPLHRMPGWNRNSIGYHGDDGKLYHENGGGTRFGPTCTKGDRMGCGIDFDSDVGYGYHDIFFTKNGAVVGDPVKMKRPVNGLYPIIGLHSRGEKVRYLGHWNRQQLGLLEPMIMDHSPCNMWLRSNAIKFMEDGLTLEYCGNGGDVQDVALAQGRYPLNKTDFYFELEILATGSLGAIAIGLGKSSYPLHNHPGWVPGAVGYHADDGKLFVEQGMGKEFGPSCSEGDRMGCGISFDVEEVAVGKAEGDHEEDMKEESESSESPYSSEDEELSPPLSEDEMDDEALFYRDLLMERPGMHVGPGMIGGPPRPNLFQRPGILGGPFGQFVRGARARRGFLRVKRREVPSEESKESLKSNVGSKCTVFFTKNGERLGETVVTIPKGGFYPLVGMLSKGEKVRVDLQPLTG